MVSERRFQLLTSGYLVLALLGGCTDTSDPPAEVQPDGSPNGGAAGSPVSGGSGGGSGATAGSSGAMSGGSSGSTAGSAGSGAASGSGGSGAAFGAGGSGATAGSAGSSGAGGTSGGNECATPVTVNEDPLGCELAWGSEGNAGNRASFLDFITMWVGDEPNGGLNGDCYDCALVRQLALTNARAVYYAYFIGFQARTAGFGDCNTDRTDGQNLCTRGAQWIRDNRARLIDMYGNYAKLTHAASPNKGVLWLLEGDFVQYTYADQSNELTMQELAGLASDIICAIKSNAANAHVAINHSAWLANEVTDQFWAAMDGRTTRQGDRWVSTPGARRPISITDMVWTTGAGNNNGFITVGTNSTSYNGATAKYSYLATASGKRLLVDTSFGPSQQADSWSNIGASMLNQRIAEGVSAVNVTQPPSDYAARLSSLQTQSTCQ
jgi:hypothetical protein